MTSSAEDLDDELDALLSVPVTEFVAARDRRVKELRAAGERDRGGAVAKLRRPPVSAWALDRVAQAQPELVAELLAVGRRLRSATSQAVRGDASELRSLRADERAAVDAVVRAALDVAGAHDHKPTDDLRRRLAATVRAALADETLGERLAAGRIVDEHAAPGFGFAEDDLAAAPAASTGAASPPRRDRRAERAAELRSRATTLAAAADQLEVEATAAEDAATRLRRRADRARVAADDARAEADRLR